MYATTEYVCATVLTVFWSKLAPLHHDHDDLEGVVT
jgi:hypothetical protein